MSRAAAFKQRATGATEVPGQPGLFDIGRMRQNHEDALARLDPHTVLQDLQRNYRMTHRCMQLCTSKTDDMEVYSQVNAGAVDGTTLILDVRKEFSAALGTFFVLLEWMELEPRTRKAKAEVAARRALLAGRDAAGEADEELEEEITETPEDYSHRRAAAHAARRREAAVAEDEDAAGAHDAPDDDDAFVPEHRRGFHDRSAWGGDFLPPDDDPW